MRLLSSRPERRSPLRRVSSARVATALVAAGTAAAVLVPSGARAATLPTTVLPGTVLAGLSTLSSAPLAADAPVQVGLVLADPAAAGLAPAYRAVYDPTSAEYHHFLSAAQVASEFGVDPATVAAVRSWATRDGLQPVLTSADGSYVLLAGTAAQAEQTFAVTMAAFTTQGVHFYANTTAPTVPQAVTGVVGLESFHRFHTFTGPNGLCLGVACLGLVTPQDLWSVYDQPTNLADPSADFGQGQQLAVLGEGAVAGPIADLRTFEAEFGLPKVPVTVKSVGDTFTDTSGSPEWDIDMQASTGMAPEAYGETLYFTKDLTDSSILGDFQAWSGDPTGPLQANASFGECEEDPTSKLLFPSGFNDMQSPLSPVLAGPAGATFEAETEQALTEANLQGKTLFSSTGDTGSSCPVVTAPVNGVANELLPETNYPASSPHAVAVGGTVLYTTPNTATAPASDATRFMETAWTFTGGGTSLYIPEPDFQDGIGLVDDVPCVARPDGTPYASPTPCRGVPDVAAISGDVVSNGYATTMNGTTDQPGGGTSLSSPLWMGMWARIQAVAPATSTGYTFGFADEMLYRIGKDPALDPGAFFDIGGGPPTSPITGNGYYTSLPRSALDPSGWDYVSGLGTPNVWALAGDAAGTATPALTNDVAAPAPQDCGQPGLPAC